MTDDPVEGVGPDIPYDAPIDDVDVGEFDQPAGDEE